MSSPSAIINKILTFSAVDGPGNRLVVFFQGCNLSCLNCHNPYTMARCNECGDCIDHCPVQALRLSPAGTMMWDAQQCDHCDTCLSVCPISASPKTTGYSVESLLEVVRDNLPFISGITLSGGEATTQLPFIIDFLKALRATPSTQHLSCLIDSNGMLGQNAWQRLLPLVDGVMLDIKAWDAQRHIAITGANNQRIKSALSLLLQEQKLAELRFLLIPGKTDFEAANADFVGMLHRLPPSTAIRINGFQQHGVVGSAQAWPAASETDIADLADLLRQNGLCNVKIPAQSQKNTPTSA